MPYTTLNSGLRLKVPTRGTRGWAQTFLDEFATALSSHDHTGSPNGVAIGTNALSANAVDDTKLRLRNNEYLRARNAAGSGDVNILRVNGSNELELALSLGTASIADGAVTSAKLATTVANALTPTGTVAPYIGTTSPTGWVLAQGGTIGNASSSATIRANADTETLFTLLWNSFADAQAAVSGGRGANAAADFAANKRITLPDLRQRFVIGKAASGTGGTLGGTGGEIDHAHSVPAHYHGMGTGADLNITASGSHTHSLSNPSPCNIPGTADAYQGATQTASNSLQNATHTHASGDFAGRIGLVTGGVDGNSAMTSGTNNPPFMALNFIIKL